MRAEVRFRPEALADIERLFWDLAHISGSVETAENYVRRLTARCHRIGAAPLGGRPRDDLLPGLRLVPFKRRLVIAFVTDGSVVEIINIFHARADYEAVYRREMPEANTDDPEGA
jgi:toxin ParE1/3/4